MDQENIVFVTPWIIPFSGEVPCPVLMQMNFIRSTSKYRYMLRFSVKVRFELNCVPNLIETEFNRESSVHVKILSLFFGKFW